MTVLPVKRLASAIIDFVYPRLCLTCRNSIPDEKTLICGKCWHGINRNSRHIVTSGARFIPGKKYFSFISWRFKYSDVMREAVRLFKFNDYHSLYRRFGEEMAETVRNIPELSRADALVPVPLHKARQRERGYNQSELLARTVSEFTGIPLHSSLLRIRNNRPQSLISGRKEKIENVRGIFEVRSPEEVNGKRIILVDDVVTTGATVNECSRVLAGAGAEQVMILSAALAGGI
ncbi:ComF family protein [candidate division KSB1 bacterium]